MTSNRFHDSDVKLETNEADETDNLVDASISDDPFRDWCLRNSVLRPSRAPTFKDANGVKRYASDWSEVPSGVETDASDSTDNSSGAYGGQFTVPIKGTNRQIILMDNYLRLWNHIALDVPGDAFGRYALMFEVSALVIFDHRTVNMATYLMYYNCFIYFVIFLLSFWFNTPYNGITGYCDRSGFI